jgi:hypothetical protein
LISGTWSVTSDPVFGTNRDDIYNSQFSKLTVDNFMNSLNDLSNNYDFSNNVRYIVIGEDNSTSV